ncbi:MAG TPA: helix-turn-helix domain-containing protein [Bacteroidota bacterium]|nr:helix-turn-helix domain-containing protein [Bacteroidota bacterium]
MTEILFNTMDVSKMLQVDKSTVKRWTDEGKLKCFRTPGGHRKFRAEDLYQFMSDYNYGISPINLYPQFASDEAILRRIITKREFNVLTNVCFSAAINGRKNELVKLFTEVYKNGLTLPLLFDEILRPTLKRISDLNHSEKLSGAEMQLAFNALSNGIVLFSDAIVKPAPTGKKAICATIEAEAHDVELKALVVLLESEGYDVLNLGVGASTETISQLIEGRKPQFVFVCCFHPTNSETLRANFGAIIEKAAAFGSKVVIGSGVSNGQDSAAQIGDEKRCATFKDFALVQRDPIVNQNTANDEKRN